MDTANTLGDYLKARRELVTPERVGLPAGGQRRVPGLRREEVAMLAGISSDYYLRLEQGRDRNPSAQVLDAIARVLQLDGDAADYLHALATPHAARPARPRREIVPASTRALLDVLGLPAFVEGRYFDVLAANPLAAAISPGFAAGRNLLRSLFLDPAFRDLYPNWDAMTSLSVAAFRRSVGRETTDPHVVSLVGELSLGSERFRRLWARHDVHVREGGNVHLRHPQVGDLDLTKEKLAVGGTDGQLLVIYHAAPGTPSADKLALLGSLSSPAPRRDPHSVP